MAWFRRQRETRDSELERLRQEREQLLAELEEVAGLAAWNSLGDDPLERADGAAWSKQEAALRSAISRVEARIFYLSVGGTRLDRS